MCGRYTLDLNAKRLAALYGLDEVLDDLPPRFNIAPSQRVPVVGVKPDGRRRGLAMLQWGFLPRFANDAKSGPRPINARSETLLGKPLFRDAAIRRRCLMPASGFFEWKAVGKRKHAHYVTLRGGEPMSFAGLWETWGRGPERIASCCIITVPANDALKTLHDRMPTILPAASFDDWLNPETPIDRAMELLRPYNTEEIAITPVGPAVNSVANDGPECIAPAT